MKRAYALLDIKSVDDDQRMIKGIASTPTPDFGDDVMDPLGAMFSLPMPLLWQHKQDEPIGHVIAASPTKDGIPITAQLVKIDEPGLLKDQLDKAWQSMKSGLVRGLSIGWRPIEASPRKGTFGLHVTKWGWHELSAVTIPMNAEATITAIKSADAPFLAALGSEKRSLSLQAGVTAVVRTSPSKDGQTMSVHDQITGAQQQREAKENRLKELMAGAAKEEVTLDAAQAEEYDRLEMEIGQLGEHIKRLERLEQLTKDGAKPVSGETSKAASESRGGKLQVQVTEQTPPGISFARAAKVATVARLDRRSMADVAKEMYPADDRLKSHIAYLERLPQVVAQMKAAVPAGTTTQTDWASALVDPTNLASEFIEFLRPETIIGRLNLRSIPFNVRVVEQTEGGTGYWVGQGAPKPLTAFGFAPVTMAITKVAAISVITQELARFSTPSADTLVRNGLRDVLVQRIDEDLLDPSQAGTTNIQPASLTNGVSPLTSAGSDPADVVTDIGTLVGAIRADNLRGPIVLVMPDTLGVALQFMTNAFGQPFFPETDRGLIRGIRFITSQYMANSSGFGNMVVAIAEREVFLADDGGVRIDASDQASLQMLDNPTNNSATATPTSVVSMWQTDSIAIRAERFINWKKRHSGAVAWMDDVNWGNVGSP